LGLAKRVVNSLKEGERATRTELVTLILASAGASPTHLFDYQREIWAPNVVLFCRSCLIKHLFLRILPVSREQVYLQIETILTMLAVNTFI
jgi:hypothetical protein